jgi:hypothetical protein
MASGQVNRANRPNTWLLRPILQSEDSSCQPGAVHTWPVADLGDERGNDRFQDYSGPDPDGSAKSPFDPKATLEKFDPAVPNMLI